MGKAPDGLMPTYPATIIVLKKTKLGESDLIITGFTDEGYQVRAVAKGARKPSSRIGAQLELYTVAKTLLQKGRSLDIVREATVLVSNAGCRSDVEHSAAAAVIVELLDKVTRDSDQEERLFALGKEALRCVGAVEQEGLRLITAGALLKIVAQLGIRPVLDVCTVCAAPLDGGQRGAWEVESVQEEMNTQGAASPAPIAFSHAQGGALCPRCASLEPEGSLVLMAPALLNWLRTLMGSRFVALEEHAHAGTEGVATEILLFLKNWLRAHLLVYLKSLDFLVNLR